MTLTSKKLQSPSRHFPKMTYLPAMSHNSTTTAATITSPRLDGEGVIQHWSVFLFSNHVSKAHGLFIGTQYQVLDVVGEGAYGIVCSAVYRPSGRKVAFSVRMCVRVFLCCFYWPSCLNQDHLHSGYHQTTFIRSIQRGLLYVSCSERSLNVT